MKVRLLRDARITHKAGEIVEVSPSEFHFLVSVGSALAVKEAPKEVEKAVIEPEAETPEKKVTKKANKKK